MRSSELLWTRSKIFNIFQKIPKIGLKHFYLDSLRALHTRDIVLSCIAVFGLGELLSIGLLNGTWQILETNTIYFQLRIFIASSLGRPI